jgi:hypothetical protein
MCGWLAQYADLLEPLHGSLQAVLFKSKVIGTDDTNVKALDVTSTLCAHRAHLAMLR